jgi:acetyltransferase-like isoleucine patch superfamily enzyme
MQFFVDAANRQGLTVSGILDNDYYGNTTDIGGIPVVGSETDIDDWKSDHDFFIATNTSPDPGHVRDSEKRKKLIDLTTEKNIKCINLIDPDCHIGSNVTLGHGIYIGYGTCIERGVVIGDFCQVYYQVGIGHDCRFGKNTIIQRKCGLGNVTTGENVYLGMWVNIFSSKHVTIGDNAIVNQALWVTRDVAPGEHVKLTRDAVRTYRNLTEIN